MQIKVETKLQHRLLLAPRQQLFLSLVNMPFFEVVDFVKKQAESNPFLEFEKLKETGFVASDVPDDNAYFDQLVHNLRLSTDSKEMLKIGEYIIENLDEDGYLRKPLSEIVRVLGTGERKVEDALKIVQSLEPAGLGARDLQESLLLQIERYLDKDSILYLIVRDYWQAVVKREHKKISGGLHIDVSDVRKEIENLKKFTSAPLRGLFKKTARYIMPEGRVVKKRGHFRVYLDEKMYPLLKINALYEKEAENPLISARERRFLRKKLEQARTLLRILSERHRFLTDVFQEIVEYQKKYLEGGSLLPLREKDIAERRGVSISTISRAVNRKYLETPAGFMKMRSFFSGSVGDSISKHFIIDRIKDILWKEGKPLSDRQIVKKLTKDGIKISVRTVNKYRHQQGILNSYLRKR